MLLGYFISIIDIIRQQQQITRMILLFSTFPLLPTIAVGIRYIRGLEYFDTTPIAIGIVYLCLYLIVFKYNDVGIIPASIKAVVEQTMHPIFIYNTDQKEFTYKNKSASEKYSDVIHAITNDMPHEGVFEQEFLNVAITPLPKGDELLLTVTDLSDLYTQIQELQNTILELERVSTSLDEENRNIDAYLDTLYHTESLKSKRIMIDKIYEQIAVTFEKLKSNFTVALQDPETSEKPLNDNMLLSEECMIQIRAAVARLREE